MKIKKRKAYPGYTIMELLVSIAIIVSISGIVLINYRHSKREGEVSLASHKIGSDIRIAQNYSLSLKEHPATGDVPDGGWGVYFSTANSDEYQIFGDNNNDGVLNPGEEFEQKKILNADVSDITITIPGSPPTVVHPVWAAVTWQPPDPEIFICYPGNCDAGVLEVEITGTWGDTKVIEVNEFGLVDVN